MIQYSIWFILLFSLLSFAGYSQQKAKKDSFDLKLSVRNAFEEPSDKASPAKASFTIPDSGKNSFLINLGISLDLLWTRQFQNDKIFVQQLSPFAVFNRNTMIDQEQYNYKGGFAYELQSGKGNDNYISVHYLNSALEYIRDKIDNSHSVLLTTYWSYLFNNTEHPDKKLFINYYKMIGNSSFFYNISPSAGLEFQDIFQSRNDSVGFQARLYVSPSASIALRRPSKSQKRAKIANHYTWPKLFELTIDYKFRYSFINTVSGSADYIPLFRPYLTYYPGQSQDFSIALSYNSGSDPTAGLKKQKYWELAVQFKK